MDILKLYNKVKNIEGVDTALINSCVKAIVKDADCETLEELVCLMQEKEKEANELHDKSSELNKENYRVLEEKKRVLAEQSELRDALTKKDIVILFAIFGVMGVAAGMVAFFPGILSIIIGIVCVLIAGKIGMDAKNNIWSGYNENQKYLDELTNRECDLSSEMNQKIFMSINLMNSIQDLNKVVETIKTFLESYAKEKGITLEEELTQDEIEQVEEVSEEKLEEGKKRTLR